jgi:exosortase A
MSTHTAAGALVVDPVHSLWRSPRPAVPALVLGLAAWAALFHTEIARAVEVWNASTAYSHCWFVLPIALYLAWDRREAATRIAMRPVLWPALLAIPGSLVWLAAERMGIMEGRQLAAIGFVELLFLAVLGRRLAWAFSASLLYLFFLVPFGAFLTLPLQRFTAAFTDVGLSVLGIPHLMDALQIEVPAGTFYIAEACAGLRFLIASIAFGALYGCLIYRSPWRRAAFLLASCIVPVIANGFRALGIVALDEALGSAEAAAADHIIYGWVFFSFVILMLILAGLPFRQDGAEPPAPPPPEPLRPPVPPAPWLAAGLLTACAAIGPAAAAAIDRGGAAAAPGVVLPGFVAAPGCTAGAAVPGRQRFTCAGFALTASVEVFAPRAPPALLVAAERRATGEDAAEEVTSGRLTGSPPHWRLVETQAPVRMTAVTLWIDGDAGLAGLRGRLRQARNSLLGSEFAPVLMAVRLDGDDTPPDRRHREQAVGTLRAFLAAQGDLEDRAAALAHAAAQ